MYIYVCVCLRFFNDVMFGFLLQNGIAKNFFQERFVLATDNFQSDKTNNTELEGVEKTSVEVSLRSPGVL